MRKLTLFFSSFLFVFVAVNAQTKLQYNLNKGDSFKINQLAKQTITQDTPVGEQIIINEIGGDMLFEVVDIKNDQYILTMRYKTFMLKMSSPTLGNLMNIDSTKKVDSTDIQGLLFKGIIDKPIQFTMKKNGDIVSLQDSENLINGMFESAGITDPSMRATIKSSIESEWNDESLLNSIEQMTFIYDQNDKKIGETWTNEYSGKLNATNTWRFDNQESEKIMISADSDVELKLETPQANMDLSGNQKTIVSIDSKTGFLVEMNVVGTAKGNTTVPMAPDTKIKTTISTKNTFKAI